MPKYTFTGVPEANKGETTVIAPNERAARALAMQERWGPAAPLTMPVPNEKPERHVVIGNPYYGHGLTLIAVED